MIITARRSFSNYTKSIEFPYHIKFLAEKYQSLTVKNILYLQTRFLEDSRRAVILYIIVNHKKIEGLRRKGFKKYPYK